MKGKDKRCDICGYKFIEGMSFKGADHVNVRIPIIGWIIRKKRRRYYICSKCRSTGEALIRNNIAIKTRDILDR